MKTIEVISGEQKAIFTTRSVTFDGREFLYINMSDVSNDTDSHVYTFRYDNEIKRLPYEAKDAAILNAIFSQVKGLPAKQAAAAGSGAGRGTAATSQSPAQNQPAPASESAPPSGMTEGQPAQAAETQTVSPEGVQDAENATALSPAEEKAARKAAKKAEKERLREEKRKEKERRKAEKAAAKAKKNDDAAAAATGENIADHVYINGDAPAASGEKAAVNVSAIAAESDTAQNAAAEQTAGTVDTGDRSEDASVKAEGASGNAETSAANANAATDKADDADASSEKVSEKGALISKFSFKKAAGSDGSAASEDDTEKKARFRKSIIVFAIIIAAMAVLALVYFFLFGTSDDPSSMNPASTNTQSYDDIDDLIDDLQ